MNNILAFSITTLLSFIIGFSFSFIPPTNVTVQGTDGKVLTVTYQKKVYKLVLLEP